MNTSKGAHHVLKRTSDYLKSGLVENQPSWYKVLAYHPPKKDSQKTVRLDTLRQVKESEPVLDSSSSQIKQGSNFFKTRLKPSEFRDVLLKPKKLEFIEDELRNLFYKQHPWELADPKSLIENDHSMDADKLDWSTMKQLTRKLDGESVVQRTLYLTKTKDMPLIESYEQAKYEYYRLKIEQETEINVTKEEQEMYGAVFGKSNIDYGFDKESEVLAEWKKQAIEQTRIMEAKLGSNSASSGSEVDFAGAEAESEDAIFSEEDIYRELEDEEKR
ncbi:hypothetical protein CANARDRAFT_27260 [[Candida] arabinofermentans NRRL YB-2248]|uniref:37S ribosomal protein S25, mitochondrial n=1 Tax=[Candida] arabinofermentans NRRL YB-2248 TaxID=983967 RepID=A0A1E4T574_9ASCO|nr:hypothetical protein CANARDRAFT_27260 [[Candida] arabinofermentans NRRL YB-2248]